MATHGTTAPHRQRSRQGNGEATRQPPAIHHLTGREHAAVGKAARATAPLADHAAFEPHDPRRPDPVALLESQAVSRVEELVPIRYGRMSASPFAFFRGAALVMADDLARTPTSGLTVQLCGDAHLVNFGLFASPERRLVFDINDFDETHPGPWEWDVKRLAASFEVATREKGLPAKQRRAIVATVGRRYREAMAELAAATDLEVWYAHADVTDLQKQLTSQLTRARKKAIAKAVAKARTKDSMQALSKLSRLVDGERRIVADPPLVVPASDLLPELERQALEEQMHEMIRRYRQSLQPDRRVLVQRYRFVDIARKVVGVGSVGTRCWILLMLGRDDNDPLFLQAKEAGPSVLEAFTRRSTYANEGQRVVQGQRLMQAYSDIFLGWDRNVGADGVRRDFYVRQLRDWKGSADVQVMVPEGLRLYAELCAWTLARAHARSGDRIAIAAYLGAKDTFDKALVEFASSYADQNERDHRALLEAIRSGRVMAQAGI